MDKGREALRHSIDTEEAYSLGVITYEHFTWVDHTVRLIDMSKNGVGVESEQRMDPGFVWFNDRVRGHKGGALIWCRKFDDKYRAGIRFVPLTSDEEHLVQEGIVRSGHQPYRNPLEIIAPLIEAMTRSKD